MGAPLLHDRFPALRTTLPHVALGDGPTPVQRLSAVTDADVWCKHDGRYGDPYGGNKVRKLEWVLADARRRGSRTVLTIGALATNHGLATAIYARRLGLDTALVLVDQPLDDHVHAQLERLRASGATLHRTRSTARTVAALPFLLARHADWRARRPPYYLPVGGSSPLGILGYVEAGLELGEQVASGALPEPAHVVVPVGSGGTVAGLALGLRLAGLRSRAVGVVVNDRMRLDAGRTARLAARATKLLRGRGAQLPEAATVRPDDVLLTRDWLGSGYGHPTAEGTEAATLLRAEDGLVLDPVYAAKAMAGLLGLARRGELAGGPGPLHRHRQRARGSDGRRLTLRPSTGRNGCHDGDGPQVDTERRRYAMSLITKLDFLAIPSQDAERSRTFYGETLGLRADDHSQYEFWVDKTCLSIWEPAKQGMPFAPQKNGHLALHVDDVAAARAELEAKGIEFAGDTFDTGVCHMAFFTDPDGNDLMLHNRYAPAK